LRLRANQDYGEAPRRKEHPVKRLITIVVASVLLPLALMVPAHAGTSGSVAWVCDVPGEGLVTFVSAPLAAAHGINTANRKAGQVFHDQFGEVCTVVATA
jgi:hypothetical protein